jgi:tRNA(adenine34) deaminase
MESTPPQPEAPDDELYMRQAIKAASDAGAVGEVPVGALIVLADRDRVPSSGDATGLGVLAVAGNRRESSCDPTAHAEILALREAAAKLGTWRLTAATIYVTLEPCPMCAGALVAARIKRVVFGAADPKAGSCGSLYNLCVDPRLNHEVDVRSGVLAEECARLLSEFFVSRR